MNVEQRAAALPPAEFDLAGQGTPMAQATVRLLTDKLHEALAAGQFANLPDALAVLSDASGGQLEDLRRVSGISRQLASLLERGSFRKDWAAMHVARTMTLDPSIRVSRLRSLPDGRILAARSEGNAGRMFFVLDPTTGEKRLSSKLEYMCQMPDMPLISSASRVMSVTMLNERPQLVLWNTVTDEFSKTDIVPDVNELGMVKNTVLKGDMLLSYSENAQMLSVYDTNAQELVERIPVTNKKIQKERAKLFDLLADGSTVWWTHDGGMIINRNGRRIKSRVLAGRSRPVHMADGSIVMVAAGDRLNQTVPRFVRWDPVTGEESDLAPVPARGVGLQLVFPNMDMVFGLVHGGMMGQDSVTVFEGARQVWHQRFPSFVSDVAISPTGEVLVACGNEITVFDD